MEGIGVQVVSIDQLVKEHLDGLDSVTEGMSKEMMVNSLRLHILKSFQDNKEARETSGVNKLLLDSLRDYNGQYSPSDLAKIRSQGGSEIFMNLTSTKVRAAISWIKDILLGGKEDAFSIETTPEVELPDDVVAKISKVVTKDFERMVEEGKQKPQQEGQPQQAPDAAETLKEINERKRDLYSAILNEINKEADFAFNLIEKKIKDGMKEGQWDYALSEVIDDFCIFPTAFLKGPIVTVQKRLRWENGEAVPSKDYVMMNKRVSPLDMYPAPEATTVNDGDLIEHLRMSRKEIASLIDAKNYDADAIRRVLSNNEGKGQPEAYDSNIEQEKAQEELRDSVDSYNKNVYHGLHFFGTAPVKLLVEWGVDDPELTERDPDDEVEIEAILVGSEVIKCVLNDDILGRRPYYSASYQKRPGSIWGTAPPYLMRDIQKMCNACARALSNNMGLSSGPIMEVVIDRLADGQEVRSLRPLDIIQTTSDPSGGSGKAVNFILVPSVAAELLAVYKEFEVRADDVTMIPRYAYGNDRNGGAGQALANYERVVTPSGTVAICDLSVGDRVCNTYGSCSTIKGVYPQGVSDIFRLTFSNGEIVDCDMNHRWSVRSHNDRPFRTLTTEEILDKGLFRKTKTSPNGLRSKWMLPYTEAVSYDAVDVSIDPYTFGAILGDGDKRARMTSMDQEVFDRIPYKLGKIDHKKDNKAWSQTILGISKKLYKYLGGANCYNKFIPEDYLRNSVTVRKEVLKGMMDTDGCISKNGDCFYFTVSEQLAKDFKELVKSLGGTVKSIQKRVDPRENRVDGYRIAFYTDFAPVHLTRKIERFKCRAKRHTYIDKKEYIGEHEATCIEVDAADHRFLVDNFIVTHNTASGMAMLLDSASKGIKDAIRHLDEGIIIPRVEMEFATVMLRGDIPFSGDIHVIAKGSQTLTMAGAQQMRRIEFLQTTANATDQEIMGPTGRAEILRTMTKDLNLGEDVIPNRQEIKAYFKKKEQNQGAPSDNVQAAQIQNETILKIAQERNQLTAADLQRKSQKDQADVQLKAQDMQQRAQSDASKLTGKLQDTKIKTASEEHRANQAIALSLKTGDKSNSV